MVKRPTASCAAPRRASLIRAELPEQARTQIHRRLPPRLGQLPAKLGHVALKLGHVALKLGHVASKLGHVASKLRHLALKLGHVAPKHRHLAPKHRHLASKLGPLASKLGHARPTPRNIALKVTNVPLMLPTEPSMLRRLRLASINSPTKNAGNKPGLCDHQPNVPPVSPNARTRE